MKSQKKDLGITYQDLLQFFETHGGAEMSCYGGKDHEKTAGALLTPLKIFQRAAGYYETNSEEGILRDYLPGTGIVFIMCLILLQECTP